MCFALAAASHLVFTPVLGLALSANGCRSHLGFTPADQWSGATPRHLAAPPPRPIADSHTLPLSAHLRALRIAPRIISQAQKISRLILRSLYLWLLYHCVKFQLQLAEVILTLELQLERKHKLVQNSYQVYAIYIFSAKQVPSDYSAK